MSRNWSKYNDELVRRGELYLELGFLESWDEELEEMNDGKHGRPYECPESFIQFAATFCTFFRLPYRQLEGVLNRLADLLYELESSDSQLSQERAVRASLPSDALHQPLQANEGAKA